MQVYVKVIKVWGFTDGEAEKPWRATRLALNAQKEEKQSEKMTNFCVMVHNRNAAGKRPRVSLFDGGKTIQSRTLVVHDVGHSYSCGKRQHLNQHEL